MKIIKQFIAERTDDHPTLPSKVLILVLENFEGKFIPEAHELGMGHSYANPDTAAHDLARRHGYPYISESPMENPNIDTPDD